MFGKCKVNNLYICVQTFPIKEYIYRRLSAQSVKLLSPFLKKKLFWMQFIKKTIAQTATTSINRKIVFFLKMDLYVFLPKPTICINVYISSHNTIYIINLYVTFFYIIFIFILFYDSQAIILANNKNKYTHKIV